MEVVLVEETLKRTHLVVSTLRTVFFTYCGEEGEDAGIQPHLRQSLWLHALQRKRYIGNKGPILAGGRKRAIREDCDKALPPGKGNTSCLFCYHLTIFLQERGCLLLVEKLPQVLHIQ